MRIKSIFATVLLITIVFLTSCVKTVLDINTNPNSPSSATLTAEAIIPGALATIAGYYDQPTTRYGNEHFQFAGIWMGHFTYSGNYAIGTSTLDYNLTNGFDGGLFDNLFIQNANFALAQQKAHAEGNTLLEGIARLMKAYNFETLVDIYNSIPYSQAEKGTNNSTPKYDDPKTIYESLNKEMDSAIILFKTSPTNSIPNIDVMFGGDPSQWLALANTMKLRLLIQQSAKSDRQTYIQTEMAKIASGPFITSDALCNPGYTTSYGQWNPMYNANYNSSGSFNQDFFVAAQYGVDFYTNNIDPRLAAFYNPVGGSGTNYKGNVFGAQGIPNSQTSMVGHGTPNSVIQGPKAPSVFMLAAESYFLQAEATLDGYLPGGAEQAQTLYENGVTASFAYLGFTSDVAQAYYTQAGNTNTTWEANPSQAQQLALIIRQKWAAETFINELPLYNDYRRLGLPADIPLSQSSYSTGHIPNRFLYPQDELNTNGPNVPAVAVTDKIWWMN